MHAHYTQSQGWTIGDSAQRVWGCEIVVVYVEGKGRKEGRGGGGESRGARS